MPTTKDRSEQELLLQIPVMWDKIDDIAKTANDAKVLAEHAARGYIELAVEVKALNKSVEKMEAINVRLEEKIDKIAGEDRRIKKYISIATAVISVLTIILKVFL